MGGKQSKPEYNVSTSHSKTKTATEAGVVTNHDYVAVIKNNFNKKEYFIEIIQASTQKRLATLMKHQGHIFCAAFNTAGTQIISGSDDTSLRLWDVASGKCLKIFAGHVRGVTRVAFNVEGTQIISASVDGTLRLWDVASKEWVQGCLKTFPADSITVGFVVFNVEGTQIISGSDKTLRLWDVASGKFLKSFVGHVAPVSSAAINTAGTQIISGDGRGTILLWDVASCEILQTFQMHGWWAVTCVAFNAAGTQIISGSDDTSLRLWDVASGKCLKIFEGHKKCVISIAFNAVGTCIISGSGDNTLRLWDVSTGQCLKEMKGFGKEGEISDYSPYIISEQLLPCGLLPEQAIEIANRYAADRKTVAEGAEAGAGKAQTTAPISTATAAAGTAVSATTITLPSSDSKTRIDTKTTNKRTATEVWQTAQSGHDYMAVALNDNSKKEYQIEIIRASNKKQVALLKGHVGFISFLAFNASGSQVLSGSDDQTLRLWDVQSGQCLKTFAGHGGNINCVVFNASGSQVLSASIDKTLRLWDVQSGQCLKVFEHTSGVCCAAFNASGTQVLSGSGDKTLRLWDVQSGQCLQTFTGHTVHATCVVFNAAGTQVLSGSCDRTLCLWDVKSGKCLKTFEGHTAWIYCVAFNESGSQVLSGSGDNTLRLWDVASGQCLKTFEGHTDTMDYVVFNATGNQVLSGSRDNTLRLWDVQSGQCLKVIKGFNTKGTLRSFSSYIIPDQLLPSGLRPSLPPSIAIDTATAATATAAAVTAVGATTITLPSSGTNTRIDTKTTGEITATEAGGVALRNPLIFERNCELNRLREGLFDNLELKMKSKKVGEQANKKLLEHLSRINVSLSKTFSMGKAASKGDCFFDALFQSLEEAEISLPAEYQGQFGYKKLRQICEKYVRQNQKNEGHWLKKLIVDKKVDYQSYVVYIGSTASEMEEMYKKSIGKGVAIWGDPHIDGRIICNMLDIKIHTIEVMHTGENEIVLYHELVDKQGNKQVLENEVDALYKDNKVMHLAVFQGSLHYVPLIHQSLRAKHEVISEGVTDFGHDYIAATLQDEKKKEYLVEITQASSEKRIAILRGHTDVIRCVAFNMSGSQVLSGSDDNTVRLWDVNSGKCLKTFAGHTRGISSVNFNANDSQVLSGGWDGTLRLWDVKSGECSKTLVGHKGGVSSVIFNVSCSQALSGSSDKTLRLWDVKSGECLKIFEGHMRDVSCVAFNANGSQVLSGSDDDSLRLWDVKSGQCLQTFAGHLQGINRVTFNASGHQVLSSGKIDNTLRLWDVASGQCLKMTKGRIAKGKYVETFSSSIIPDQLLSSGLRPSSYFSATAAAGATTITLPSSEAKTRMDTKTTNEIMATEVRDVTKTLHDYVAVFQNNEKEYQVEIIQASSKKRIALLKGHTDAVKCVAFNASGNQILSGSKDNTLRLWDVQSAQCLKTFAGHTKPVTCVAFNTKGNQVLSGSEDNTVRLWDTKSGQCLKSLDGHTKLIRFVSFNSDSSQVLSGSEDNTVRLWDVQSGQCLKTLAGHTKPVTCAVFNASDSQVLSGSRDGTLRLWDVANGQCLKSFVGQIGGPSCVAFNANGSQVLSGGAMDMYLWDVKNGQVIQKIESLAVVCYVAFNASGNQALSAELLDQSLKVWDLNSGQCLKGIENFNTKNSFRTCSSFIMPEQLLPSGLCPSLPSSTTAAEALSAVQSKAGFSATNPLVTANATITIAGIRTAVPATATASFPAATAGTTDGAITAANAITITSSSDLKTNQESNKLNSTSLVLAAEHIQFLQQLQELGVSADAIHSVQTQVQELSVKQHLLAQDVTLYSAWLKEFLPKLNQLDSHLDFAQKLLQGNAQVKTEQAHIDKQPKLKTYQKRLQKELCRFMTCYYLAPAGIFRLEDNKKDSVIAAIGAAPIAGSFLKPLTSILSYANKKNRFKQMNRLADLFSDTAEIVQISCQFARLITLAKAPEIEQQVEVEYTGWRKIIGLYQKAKAAIEQQWKDLATADSTGLEFSPADKLAIMDVAYLLQQILSGDAEVAKEEELISQFMIILTRKPYSSASSPQNTIGVTISAPMIVTPTARATNTSNVSLQTAAGSPAFAISPSSPTSPSLDEMTKRLQLLEEQTKQAKAKEAEATLREEAMQRELEQTKLRQAKLEESMKDAGISVGDGDMAQALASPTMNPNKVANTDMQYLFEQQREHAEQLRILTLHASSIGDSMVRREDVEVLVAATVKQHVKVSK